MYEVELFLLCILHVDILLRVIVPMGSSVDVLLEYVVVDPDVVEADVRRLGTRILPSIVQAVLDIIGILAQLPGPQLEVIGVLAGHTPLPCSSLMRPRRIEPRYLDPICLHPRSHPGSYGGA